MQTIASQLVARAVCGCIPPVLKRYVVRFKWSLRLKNQSYATESLWFTCNMEWSFDQPKNDVNLITSSYTIWHQKVVFSLSLTLDLAKNWRFNDRFVIVCYSQSLIPLHNLLIDFLSFNILSQRAVYGIYRARCDDHDHWHWLSLRKLTFSTTGSFHFSKLLCRLCIDRVAANDRTGSHLHHIMSSVRIRVSSDVFDRLTVLQEAWHSCSVGSVVSHLLVW